MYEYGTVKPAEVILRREWGRKVNGGDASKLGYKMFIYENVLTKPPV
jgi:hypothetical protein